MHIELSGHHVEITDGIRENVNTKFAKIESHYPQLDTLSVTLTVERNVQSIEVNTQYLGASIAVKAEGQEMYAAIADSAKKLDAALSHRKGAQKSHRQPKAASA